MKAAQEAERIASAVERRPKSDNQAIARGAREIGVKVAAGGKRVARVAHVMGPGAKPFDRT